MAEETDGEHKASAIELLALKDSFNRRITYGTSGLNARQAKEVLDGKLDWPKIWAEYRKWNVRGRGSIFITKPLWLISAVVAFIVLVWLGGNWRYGGYALLVWVAYQAAKAQGHSEGYYDGYTDAHGLTMKKMLGITDEEEKDLHERAVEIEIDSRVLDRAEDRLKQGTPSDYR